MGRRSGVGLQGFGPEARGRRGLGRRRIRLAGRPEWEIPPPAAWPNGNAAGACGSNIDGLQSLLAVT